MLGAELAAQWSSEAMTRAPGAHGWTMRNVEEATLWRLAQELERMLGKVILYQDGQQNLPFSLKPPFNVCPLSDSPGTAVSQCHQPYGHDGQLHGHLAGPHPCVPPENGLLRLEGAWGGIRSSSSRAGSI